MNKGNSEVTDLIFKVVPSGECIQGHAKSIRISEKTTSRSHDTDMQCRQQIAQIMLASAVVYEDAKRVFWGAQSLIDAFRLDAHH